MPFFIHHICNLTHSTRVYLHLNLHGQVFWLPDHPTGRAFPFHLSEQWRHAVFVPDYSGGSTTDLHRLPFLSPYCPADTRRQSGPPITARNLNYFFRCVKKKAWEKYNSPVSFIEPQNSLHFSVSLGFPRSHATHENERTFVNQHVNG